MNGDNDGVMTVTRRNKTMHKEKNMTLLDLRLHDLCSFHQFGYERKRNISHEGITYRSHKFILQSVPLCQNNFRDAPLTK